MAIYVLQTRTGKEREIIDRLSREAPGHPGVLHQPRRLMKIRRQGKVKTEAQSLYPGYLFWEIDEDELTAESCEILRRTSGVGRFLPDNLNPRPLPREEERFLLRFFRMGETAPLSKVTYDDNQRIQVVSGPLKGLEGSIVKVDRRKQRARVRLDLYKECHLIDFSFDLITAESSTKG